MSYAYFFINPMPNPTGCYGITNALGPSLLPSRGLHHKVLQCDQIGRFIGLWATFFLKPLATIHLPKSLTFFSNFCKVVKIYPFSGEIIFGQLLKTFGEFFLVTLQSSMITLPDIRIHIRSAEP